MTGDALLEANLAVFETHFPELHARLKVQGDPLSSVVFQDGAAVDIDLGSGLLYRADGRETAAEQVSQFLKSPAQIGYFLPNPEEFDSLVSRKAHMRLLSMLVDNELTEMPLRTKDSSGFMFVFGVGLGYHLKPLIEGLTAPHVVICEAFEEFLLASMRVIDWGELIELCESRNGSLSVVCANTPEELTARVGDPIDKYGPIYLDGSYFYIHYPLWTYTESRRRMINELPRQMAARGYFEDERKMVRNTVTNFHKGSFGILTEYFRARSNIPVFVIGAGPSLDEALPYAVQWRDHAIVVSAGTGLQPCLKAGIIPDFHIELENTYTIYQKLSHILGEFPDLFPNGRFDGIRLVGSSTLNPTVAPLFPEVYYFFRDSSSSSHAFGREFGFHVGIAPTVANTALGVLAHMGLGDIYLFGIDCGWRDDSTHHAKDTFYYTSDELRLTHMQGAYTLPGNFGGTVQSNMVFEWSRNLLEAAIAALRLNVYNCSDGALIKGATPLVAEAMSFDGPPLDREAVMKTVFDAAPRFQPGEFFASRPLTTCWERLEWYETRLFEIVDQAIAERWKFLKFYDAFWKRFVDSDDRNFGIATVVYYASVTFFRHSCIIMNRVNSSEKRTQVEVGFYKLFRTFHEEMFEEVRDHLKAIEAWIAGGPEPEWTDGLPRVPGTTY